MQELSYNLPKVPVPDQRHKIHNMKTQSISRDIVSVKLFNHKC